MWLLVEQEQRVIAEQHTDRGVGLSGVKQYGVAGEEALDLGGVGDHDEREVRDRQREDVTEAAMVALHDELFAEQEPGAEDRGRYPRRGRRSPPRCAYRR